MKLRIVLVALVAAGLGLGIWLLTGTGEPANPTLLPGLAPTVADTSPAQDSTELERASEDADAAGAGSDRVAVASEDMAAAGEEDPWAGELAGVTGRVVEEDGTPVEDILVTLMEADADFLLASDWAQQGLEPPDLVLAETRTDEEGRFLMEGAYDAAFQGLAVDMAGPRSTLRFIDDQLHHDELNDVGDIVLRKGCTVTGQVLSEAGVGEPGVRVRLVPLPEAQIPEEQLQSFTRLNIQDVRPDCAAAISKVIAEGGVMPVIEAPPMLRNYMDRLPIPTTTTDGEGRFRFEGVRIGQLLAAIDRPGALGDMRIVETKAGEQELEEFVLRAGRTLAGRVIDMAGEPVAGAEVLGGCEVFLGEVSVLQPAGRSDVDGYFQVSGMPLEGTPVAAARRAPDEPWVAVMGFGMDQLEIELEEAFPMTVRLVDTGGEPVTGAEVVVRPAGEGQEQAIIARVMGIGATEEPPTRFKETEPGVYVADALTPGLYYVEGRSRGLAPVVETHDLWDGEPDLTLTLPTGYSLDLKVIAAGTGEPVPAARASVVRTENWFMLRSLATGLTDEEGQVRLGPYTTTRPESEQKSGMSWGAPDELRVVVRHPRFADSTIDLDLEAAVARVELQRGGELRGTIRWGSDPPQMPYMITAVRDEGSEFIANMMSPPRLSRSGLDGKFRFSSLPPGEYEINVFERWFDEDPIELMMDRKQPVLLHQQDGLQLEADQILELDIDLTPDGQGQTATLAGNVRMNGNPVEDARVQVRGPGAWKTARTDVNGDYLTEPFLVSNGSVRVTVSADLPDGDGDTSRSELFSDKVELTAGQAGRLDVDAIQNEAAVRVVDADGIPVEHVSVRITREGSWSGSSSGTDHEGIARFEVVGAGQYVATAEAEGYVDSSVDIFVEDGVVAEPVDLVLTPSLPCAGTCDLTAVNYAEAENVYMQVSSSDVEGFDGEWHGIDDEDVKDDGIASFSIDGLSPGTYRASFWLGQPGSGMTAPVEFVLPEGGDTNLLIRAEPR